MTNYKGLKFPDVFGSNGSSVVVEGKDKVISDLNLLLRQDLNELYFRPDLGINFKMLLFSDDVEITRDFIYTFVSNSVVSTMEDVSLENVNVTIKDSVAHIDLIFIYKVGNVEFNLGYDLGGVL